MANPLLQDGLATLVTFVLALSWLKLMDGLAYRGLLQQTLSRKLIHIGTGPLFILCWPLFSDQGGARYWAALVPLTFTAKFLAIGLGWLVDAAAVQSMTRNNQPQEILRGPLYYGVVMVICTVLFWRQSPLGILALMMMCGGDGLADIVGRRWGRHKLPFSPEKSWAGSTAMFVASVLFGWGALQLFSALGYGQLGGGPGQVAIAPLLLIAAVATLVEALPFKDIDNLTLPLTVLVLGQMVLPG
ncbi:Phytol kinase [Halomicronema hongdechloris C2206]|uniref:Phytol kinase n=1 Tax=Halomicronema hongdechloris C2206 TaxID=1641165 RepID=A0A1Z3HLS0_9CYAN|nr:phosphatidate cytidylyltransferase [Halomicronema hongdechloris]ASC71251.1 Phytol kinase [Halomicronema hongdechloris C2206]